MAVIEIQASESEGRRSSITASSECPTHNVEGETDREYLSRGRLSSQSDDRTNTGRDIQTASRPIINPTC
ncbi:unnamed protein product [Macrosiphum euphorbiae]|uniref:Uncharacterized protein n=1 Tax=Macrosiphum euphorbiae TaxID=13131 RepID=A0AAV0WKV0_9HEMI|nr:unnamed protein product [Macrosiphum euphorbiae]